MKRDCGPGILRPIKFTVVSCAGESDDEVETIHSNLKEALVEFIARQMSLTECSNVRLYAVDKQGYANCIKVKLYVRAAK